MTRAVLAGGGSRRPDAGLPRAVRGLVMSRLMLLLVMIGLLSACSSATLRLMPTPTLLTQGEPTLFDTGWVNAQSTAIEVLYATNRLPLESSDKRSYSRTRSDDLRLGVATLRVGDGTKTWESLRAMSTSAVEGERPEISLIAAREMAVLEADASAAGPGAEAFFALVDELLARSGDRALSFAEWRHRVSRAGRPNLADIGPEETRWLVGASGREELDVLSIRPEDLPGLPPTSHAFWYDHPWVSSDILLKLQFHAPRWRGA